MKNKPIVLIKYGGNAMLNESLQQEVVHNITRLHNSGYQVVLVHGGGPFIKKMLNTVQVESEFVGGHRKTTPEALRYIEMVLKGEVNGQLVRYLNEVGLRAIGLSGKDARMVVAKKRYHIEKVNGTTSKHDLGQVGDIVSIDTSLLNLLLENDYLPVFTCLASDEAGNDYNINADMFAGHLAGALKADHYLVLTDVDGLLKDIKDEDSLIQSLLVKDLDALYGDVIKGGMIPKVQSCDIALKEGAKSARIINGTKPAQIFQSIQNNQSIGTEICLQ
jgi:acetylglutamate kinase